MKKWVVVSIASALLLGALAFAGYRIYLNEARDDAVELVPPNALAYGNLFLDPSTHQKQALRDLLSRFPGAGTPARAKDALEGFLDSALSGTGIDFTHDVEPWVGRQVAFAVLPPSNDGAPGVAAFVAARDTDRALDAVHEARAEAGVALDSGSYRDATYETGPAGTTTGIVRDFLVIASDVDSFRRVVDASEGDSLGSRDAFESTVSLLPPDRSALFYVSLPGIVRQLEGAGVPVSRIEALTGVAPVAIGGYLRPDGIVLESASRSNSPDTKPGVGAIARVPRGAWAAIGLRDLGPTLRTGVANIPSGTPGLVAEVVLGQLESVTGLDVREDVLPWMGDAALFAEGARSFRGGLVVATDDPQSSTEAVARIGEGLRDQGVPAVVQRHDASHATVAFADPSLPSLVELVARPAAVWLTYGANTPDEIDGATLDGRAFRAAEDALRGYAMAGFLDVAGAVAFAEQQYLRTSAALPPDYLARVKPNLEPLSYVVAGTRTSDGVTSVRIKIGVE